MKYSLTLLLPLLVLSLASMAAASLVVGPDGAHYRLDRRGRLFFFNGNRGFDVDAARDLCSRLDGRLPTIHSAEELLFLKELTDTAIWLGARLLANGSYAWDDGSRESPCLSLSVLIRVL